MGVAMPTIDELIQERLTRLRSEDAHLGRTETGIRQQREALKREIEQLEITHNVVRSLTDTVHVSDSVKATVHRATDDLDLDGLTIADAAEQILKARGGEADVGELLRVLREAGRISKGAGSYGTLGKALDRHPSRFSKTGRGRWRLVGEPEQRHEVTYVTE